VLLLNARIRSSTIAISSQFSFVLHHNFVEQWYREVVEVGHEGCAFKPMLSQGNVKTTVATIIFNASCQHASLTSGDFAYNSYPVARPFIMHGDPDKLLDEKRSAASRSLSGEIESDKFFRYMPTKVDSVKRM
jgi:hypothetical protein